jgi:hypothetical protein
MFYKSSVTLKLLAGYVKKNALCYGEFVNKRFLLFKKKVKGIVGIMKSPHQNFLYPLYI